ncbi:MAG: hypothetical protein ACYC2G_12325 [Gemmatimonadaceae bacterium]
MEQQDDPREHSYPTGRGYGHDYMRGGELQGGYGYSARPDYQRRRGDRRDEGSDAHNDARGDARGDGRLDGRFDEAGASDARHTGSAQQRPRRRPTTSPDGRPSNAP